jgi:hypothetical protein
VQVDHNLITDAETGNQFSVIVQYSEQMTTTIPAQLAFDDDVNASGTLTFVRWYWVNSTHYRADFVVNDANDFSGTVNITVSGAMDVAGNIQNLKTQDKVFSVDTENPVTVNIALSDASISDADAGTILNITIEYSEAMDTSVPVHIHFSPDINWSGSLSYINWFWLDSTHFVVNYDVLNINEYVPSVNVFTTGGVDINGNSEHTVVRTSLISLDTLNPEMTSIVLSDYLIIDSDTHTNFEVIVEYNEPMDMNSVPSLAFSPNIAVGGTLSYSNWGWTDSTHFHGMYLVLDANSDTPAVSITVTGALDAAGNIQSPFTASNLFEVDTLNPYVFDIVVTNSVISEVDLTQQLTIEYSEPMDISVYPTVEIVDISSPLSDLSGGTWLDTTHYRVSLLLNDDDEEDSTINVRVNTARDLIGNIQVSSVTSDLFVVDTLHASILSMQSSYQYLTDGEDGMLLTVEIQYNEAMNTAIPASVELWPDLETTGTLTFDTWSWTDSTLFEASYTINDVNEMQQTVFVRVHNAEDVSGNIQLEHNQSLFSVDTVNPVVSEMTIGNALISEATISSLLNLTMEFSEDMNTLITPVIVFSPNILISGSGSITVFSADWYSSRHYRVKYSMFDKDQEIHEIDISVSGAIDLQGNTQVVYKVMDMLSLDTIKPGIQDNTVAAPTTGDAFTFKATVTDGFDIGSVSVMYWYGNSATRFTGQMTLVSGIYEHTVTIPSDSLTAVNYIIHADDSSQNSNAIPAKVLQVTDNDKPSMVETATTSLTTGDPYKLNIDVTENIAVSEVWIEYSMFLHNGYVLDRLATPESVTLGRYYFDIPVLPNATNLNYDVFARDSSGNVQEMSMVKVVTDNDAPEIQFDILGAYEETGAYIEGTEVTMDASDTTDNRGNPAEYTWSINMSVGGKTVSFGVLFGDIQYYTFTLSEEYTITIFVTDTSGNFDKEIIDILVDSDLDSDGIPDTVDNDKDGDGIPNTWESSHGLDQGDSEDRNYDFDNDGLSNLEEYQNHTNPKKADSDLDGIPDGWEVENGLDPLVDDTDLDSDGDDFTNKEEYDASTDPLDAESKPADGFILPCWWPIIVIVIVLLLAMAATGRRGKSSRYVPVSDARVFGRQVPESEMREFAPMRDLRQARRYAEQFGECPTCRAIMPMDSPSCPGCGENFIDDEDMAAPPRYGRSIEENIESKFRELEDLGKGQ